MYRWMNLTRSAQQETAPQPQLHSEKATLLPTIHWTCHICQRHRNSVAALRIQHCLVQS
jgi:hypothetical protein